VIPTAAVVRPISYAPDIAGSPTNYPYGQLPWGGRSAVHDPAIYSSSYPYPNLRDKATSASPSRQTPTKHNTHPFDHLVLGNPVSTPFAIVDNPYLGEDLARAFDPAIFDKPFDGRYLCNVPGCPLTFTRKADRDRHVQSWHYCATLYFCPVPGCKKSLGKPYSRKDKLQEHMRKKHGGRA
jgi:hypothetical protein